MPIFPTKQSVGSYAWASRPAASTANNGGIIRITDVGPAGGSLWISDGTYWKPESGVVLLGMSAVASSVTGTSSQTVLGTVALPAGIMGINGCIRISCQFSGTASANTKTYAILLGGISGTAFFLVQPTTTPNYAIQKSIQNRGATNSQIGFATSSTIGTGALTNTATSGTVDTSVSQTLVFTGQLTTTSETISLQSYVVELLVF